MIYLVKRNEVILCLMDVVNIVCIIYSIMDFPAGDSLRFIADTVSTRGKKSENLTILRASITRKDFPIPETQNRPHVSHISRKKQLTRQAPRRIMFISI